MVAFKKLLALAAFGAATVVSGSAGADLLDLPPIGPPGGSIELEVVGELPGLYFMEATPTPDLVGLPVVFKCSGTVVGASVLLPGPNVVLLPNFPTTDVYTAEVFGMTKGLEGEPGAN